MDVSTYATTVVHSGGSKWQVVGDAFAFCIHVHCAFIEGSLEVKRPTIWRDEKQSREEA